MHKKTNIQYLCNVRKIKSSELAKLLGIAQSHMSLIVNGRQKLTADMRFRISQILGCSINDIKYEGEDETNITPVSLAPIINSNSINTLSIPFYDIEASAGNGIISLTEEIRMNINFEYFTKTTGLMIKEYDMDRKRFAFISIKGNSMSPKLVDGGIALLDLSVKSIATNKQILVFHDPANNFYTKEMWIPSYGKMSIVSYNEEYKTLLDANEAAVKDYYGEITIVGKIIWHGQRI